MPFSEWERALSMRAVRALALVVLSREVSPLSGGRVLLGCGLCRRSGGASLPEPVLSASGGRRCASPRGPSHGCSSARAAPRAPSSSALGARRPRPLSPAPAAACLCCFLSSARPWLAAPGSARGWGGLPLRGLHAPAAAPASRRACTSPCRLQRAAARITGPSSSRSELRVWGEGKPASSGGGGGGGSVAASVASAPRNSRSRWRRTDAGMARGTVQPAYELASCGRGGARQALTRPWPRAARGAPGAVASRHLARAGASPRARVPRAESRRQRARLSAFPGRRAQPLRRAAGPAIRPAAPLWPD